LTLLFEGHPLTQGHEILSLKTRVLAAANSEDFMILACTVLIRIMICSLLSLLLPYTHLQYADESLRQNTVREIHFLFFPSCDLWFLSEVDELADLTALCSAAICRSSSDIASWIAASKLEFILRPLYSKR